MKKGGKTTGAGPGGKGYAKEKSGGNLNYQPRTSPANGVPTRCKPQKRSKK